MQQTLLAIDDSPDVHALLHARLKHEGLVIRHAEDGESGLALARTLRPDIILLDVDMPELSGFEVCRRLKANADTSAIPVIFLTGTNTSFVKVEAFDLGAVDYVTKPFDAAELRARVRAALRTKRYLDLLALRAEIDGLTGLFNRRHFDRRLSEMLARQRQSSQPVGLVMLDIDHFKQVNDRYGHPFGDRVIQLVGETIAACVRGGDVACRYGGEEFALLLDDTATAGAMRLANRLRAVLAATRLEHNGCEVAVTASFGVASTEDFSAPASERQLVCAADNALYAAKNAGRDRVCAAAKRARAAESAQTAE